MAAMTASLSTRWDLPAFDLPPTAPGTGPFTSREFLETWWRHRAEPGDELLLMASEQALLPLLRRGELVAFLGEQDLTDYHSPRGADLAEVVASLVGVADPGWRFDLNSVPEPAATRLAESFESAGVAATVTRHQSAALVVLPGSHERYLEDLGKKQRHEVRRKRRRFADELGEPRLLRAVGDDAVAAFAAMHRLAAGDKGAFMTAGMEAFFVALHHEAGGVVDVLCGEDGVPVAAGFGFEDPDGYYLYNSAFDPAAGPASPGLVLVSLLLERAIADGKTVFDFLKGDEEYKFRLGATARPLFRVTGRFGAAG
jgi:CelD/BcsL family acetyltransferase involved in cellulose biosynthesis